MATILTNREAVVNTHREYADSQPVDNGGMNFAANLKAVRELRKLTQAELAALCDWEHPSRVTNYESQSANTRNRRKPDPNDIYLMAEKLRVPVSLLFSATPPESLDDLPTASPSARLDPAILRDANLVIVSNYLSAGATFEPDLDRDADLIALAYRWAADISDTAAYTAMQAALSERLGGDEHGERGDGKAADGPRGKSARK